MNQEQQFHHKSDKEILVELMEMYGDMVLRIAYTYVKEKQLAEDLAQEVFIRCYQSLHTFEKRSSYRTWLYRIAVNQCKDYVKSWTFRNFIPSDTLKLESSHESDTVSAHVLRQEEDSILFRNVLDLPVKLREVIIFYYYEELSVEEIAVLLGIKVNTVKTRLHRARKNLKQTMEGGTTIEF
ncbi:sigma-70 family RNA polymerase sigma factor [Sediminibacillus massiliensis]|uniref:sigma-70 family RNA polymerase sigma factor n=1 Tax=Sediminibacillus massiliensis TaxID=1926277 RepID=UPI00098859FD|nr:sigma-70 family RNA polymerase sigma factor [Sediminibacillus massiliensis]